MGVGNNKLKFTITKEQLTEMYLDKHMTGLQIAQSFGCGRQTIHNYLNKFNIERRHQVDYRLKRRSRSVDIKMIEKSFMLDGLNTEEIALKLGISKTFCKKIIGQLNLNYKKRMTQKNKSRFVRQHGYIWKYEPTHPRALRNKGKRFGFVREHILIAEKVIGRYLKDNEVVHHINGIKSDNRPENLYVCTNKEHRLQHSNLERVAMGLVRAGVIKFSQERGGYYV